MLTNQRLATHKPRDILPEHSLMHSKHGITTTQDMLDTLKFKSPLPLQVITLTDTIPDPLRDSSAAQDIPLPDAPSTAPTAAKG
jgi:hypothetical protein